MQIKHKNKSYNMEITLNVKVYRSMLNMPYQKMLPIGNFSNQKPLNVNPSLFIKCVHDFVVFEF